MYLKFFAATGVGALLLLAPARADAACCDKGMHHMNMACCDKADMKCCETEVNAVAVLLSLDQSRVTAPVRQTAEVWFKRPTLVGRSILQGRYVIEHDNDRQARGEPCTRIYAFNDRTRPVVEFHCVHLERGVTTTQNVIKLNSLYDGWQELTDFQFAGDSVAHGYPYPDIK